MYNAHKMMYKNEGVDSKELRRRREDEEIQLRKQKREIRVSVNRKIDEDDIPNAIPNQKYDWTYFKTTFVRSMFCGNTEKQLQEAQHFRKFLLTLQKSPINDIINTGLISKYVEIMKNTVNEKLKFEAVWIVEYVSNGTSSQILRLLENDAVPVLISMLELPNDDDIKELAVMSLGNIAINNSDYRDYVLKMDIMNPLLKLLSNSLEIQIIRNCVWVISCLCRGNSPSPNLTVIMTALPALAKLLHHYDTLVLVETCWALAYLCDGRTENIQTVIDADVCSILVKLLMHAQEYVVIAALRAIGNILSSDGSQYQRFLNYSFLPYLHALLGSSDQYIRKDVCWIISKITAENESQIQTIINQNIFPSIIRLMVSDKFMIKREAAWALTNAITKGTQQQIQYLVEQNCIPALTNLLDLKDLTVIMAALNNLEHILSVGKQLARQTGTINRYANLMEECHALEKFEILMMHRNVYVNEKASEILECFFSVAEFDAPFEQTEHFDFMNQNTQMNFQF